MADGRVEYEIRGDDSKLDEDLDRAQGKVEGSAGKLGGIAKGAALAVGAAAATAVVAVGVSAVKSAVSMDQAMNDFIASTGKGIEETERYQNVLEDIYANNYGESFEDIADNMALVTQQMGDMSDAELQKVVESAYLLSDTFEIDIQESIRGANAMMNQFGIDSETAYNMMAQGAQAGLNQNGDLADQIAEYSVYYSQLGLSVEDMMNAMAAGVESGAYQVDYLNDAMKEFGIRSKDGSDTSKQAFESLGLNADKMFKAFAEGGDASAEAFKEVSTRLLDMDDKVAQDALGVALFGTKWEDVGVQGISALAGLEGSIDSTKDALGEMEEIKYDDLGSMFEALQRSVELLLLPLGEMLIPILQTLLEAIMPIVETALPPLIDLIGAIMPLFSAVIELLMPIIELFMGLLTPIIQLIEDAIDPLVDALTPLIELISNILSPVLMILQEVFKSVFAGISDVVSGTIGKITDIFKNIIDFIKNVFTGNWKGAWENIKNIFSNIASGLGNIFKAPINFIIDLINGFIKGLNKIKIPDWVPGVGGKGINIPTIPRLKVGMDYVPSDDFPALLHEGEAVLTKQEASLWRSLGGNLQGLAGPSSTVHSNNFGNNDTPINVTIEGDIHTHVDLDAKVLGVAVSPIVGQELSISVRRNR